MSKKTSIKKNLQNFFQITLNLMTNIMMNIESDKKNMLHKNINFQKIQDKYVFCSSNEKNSECYNPQVYNRSFSRE